MQNEVNKTAKQLREQGYDVVLKSLSGQEMEKIKFENKSSDLNSALRNVVTDYEGKNLNGIFLLTDGIYNSGESPLYTPWRVPIHTIGLGDTTEHPDLILKNVAYNKIAYQGNRFPVRAEVAIQNLPDQNVQVSIYKNNGLVSLLGKNTDKKSVLEFDFLVDANDKGIQRLDIVVGSVSRESNLRNNRASIFVEVVEGKKKILLVAPAPH